MLDYSMLYGFLVSLGVGALVGIERERDQNRREDVTGARTFILIALLGTTTALIAETYSGLIPMVLAAGLVMLIGLGYYATGVRGKDVGLTTEVTALMVFSFGLLAYSPATREVSITLAIITAILLALKKNVHEFAKEIHRYELFDTLKFCVIAFIILPLLPNTTIDPWRVINPHKVWLLVVLISAISYFGYILVKILGPDKGIGLTGFLGGLTSSTAVTTAMASKVKQARSLLKPAAFATIVASSVMFPRILFEVAVVNKSLLPRLLLPMTAMFAAGIISSLATWHKKSEIKAEFDLKTPFALKPAVKFGAFFVFILFFSHFAQAYLGSRGIYAASVVSGLADVDAITLSMATMAGRGEISADLAVTAITIAAIINTVMKLVYARLMGSREFSRLIGAATILMAAAGGAALFLM